MGKFEFKPDAVALKPMKKTLTMADRARIEAEVPKKMTRAEAKEKKESEVSKLFSLLTDITHKKNGGSRSGGNRKPRPDLFDPVLRYKLYC